LVPAVPPSDLALLRLIDEGVAGETGEGFFRSLILALARALAVANAFACEFSPDRSLALLFAEWRNDRLVDDPAPFALSGTPCELTLSGEIVAFESAVALRYPCLRELAAESYLAIPIKTRGGEVVGHLAAIDTRPRRWAETDFGVLRIFAVRAAAEIERRRFEQELQAARLAAEQANRAKSQFLAHMSHEIRTPLNAMFGYAQLLARAPDLTPAQREAVDQITAAGEHLLGLVSEALDITKIEAGRIELNLEAVDLAQLLEQALGVARLRMREHGVAFTVVMPPAWPPRLLLDERKLRQILLNLLNNAAQFTPRGKVEFAVTCQPDHLRGECRLEFAVADTGIGFDASEGARIFEPFYRSAEGVRTAAGSGLGLAIVRRLVELMHGGISADSTPGLGSVFRVWLTAAMANADDAPLAAADRVRLSELLALARHGDITGIQHLLHELGTAGALVPDRLRTLRSLTGRYDMKGMRAYLQALLA
jgi:signal transduction histidine kinase